MTAVGPRQFNVSEMQTLQRGITRNHRAVAQFTTTGDYTLSQSHLFVALVKQLWSWMTRDKNTVVLSRSQSALVFTKIEKWGPSSSSTDANELYNKMKDDHEGEWEDFLKEVGKGLPDPGQNPHFQSPNSEVRAGKQFIYKMCEHAATTHSTTSRTRIAVGESIPQPRPLPSGPAPVPPAPLQMQALPALGEGVTQPQKPRAVAARSVTQSRCNTDAKRIIGTTVSSSDQEVATGGYNWKVAYSGPKHPLQVYATQASNAIIASSGTFSNYQREPFKSVNVDPTDNLRPPKFESAEQMFHYYKFPPSDAVSRIAILQTTTPNSARITAQTHFKPQYRTQWAQANRELMVFIQLTKALESKTRLYEALLESGDDFIIEDTSSRKNTPFPETTWGDNGDGSGENWLGWAQMKARDYIHEKIGQSGTFTEDNVKEYFRSNVQSGLNAYYAQYK